MLLLDCGLEPQHFNTLLVDVLSTMLGHLLYFLTIGRKRYSFHHMALLGGGPFFVAGSVVPQETWSLSPTWQLTNNELD
jgi:hypothetical protein